MTKTDKDFDAVESMRRIRDELSAEFSGMSFEEQKQRMNRELAGVQVARDGGDGRSNSARD